MPLKNFPFGPNVGRIIEQGLISSTRNIWANEEHRCQSEPRVDVLRPFAKEGFTGSSHTCNVHRIICMCVCVSAGGMGAQPLLNHQRGVKTQTVKKHWKY